MKHSSIFVIVTWIASMSVSFGSDKSSAFEESIPSHGGSDMQIVLPAPSHFLQQDIRWADEEIGGSNEKIRYVGCTLCSLSMALNGLGEDTNPKGLNQLLKEHGGYTSRGWLV